MIAERGVVCDRLGVGGIVRGIDLGDGESWLENQS